MLTEIVTRTYRRFLIRCSDWGTRNVVAQYWHAIRMRQGKCCGAVLTCTTHETGKVLWRSTDMHFTWDRESVVAQCCHALYMRQGKCCGAVLTCTAREIGKVLWRSTDMHCTWDREKYCGAVLTCTAHETGKNIVAQYWHALHVRQGRCCYCSFYDIIKIYIYK
jgi:hypothetical protein